MLLLQKAFYIPDRYSRVHTEGGNKRLLESARCNLIFRVISVIMKKIKVEIDDAENRMIPSCMDGSDCANTTSKTPMKAHGLQEWVRIIFSE